MRMFGYSSDVEGKEFETPNGRAYFDFNGDLNYIQEEVQKEVVTKTIKEEYEKFEKSKEQKEKSRVEELITEYNKAARTRIKNKGK